MINYHKYCRFCGKEHTTQEFPQKCIHCKQLTWHSPSPVAVLLQPMYDQSHRVGILLGQRNINPQKGKWGLIGGFVDPTDPDILHAAAREFQEETDVTIAREGLHMVSSMSDGKHLLIFVRNNTHLPCTLIDYFTSNEECAALRIAWEPEELCFQSNTDALKAWFDEHPA